MDLDAVQDMVLVTPGRKRRGWKRARVAWSGATRGGGEAPARAPGVARGLRFVANVENCSIRIRSLPIIDSR